MKNFLFIFFVLCALSSNAQKDSSRSGGFQKDHLITGGSVTLSFSSNGSILGASPFLGYRITKWLDAGIIFNFLYSSTRHLVYTDGFNYYYTDNKGRETIMGPGAFVRIYPVKFLFAQAQAEQNFIRRKTIYPDNSPSDIEKFKPFSFLVGAGLSQGREDSEDVFYYISLLFDVAKDQNSPYVEQTASGKVNILPIIRAGIQIPLFTGNKLF